MRCGARCCPKRSSVKKRASSCAGRPVTARPRLRIVFDRASDRVCKSCVLCAQCWQKDYVTTLAALNDVTQPMLARGRAEMQDFPYHFSSRCVHLPELIRAINSALFALRERQSLRRQQEENRSLLARQYAGITDILRQPRSR